VKSDILLLRLALAEQALKAPKTREHIEALRSRFDAAALRGDKLHQQEEARFDLYASRNKEKALALRRRIGSCSASRAMLASCSKRRSR